MPDLILAVFFENSENVNLIEVNYKNCLLNEAFFIVFIKKILENARLSVVVFVIMFVYLRKCSFRACPFRHFYWKNARFWMVVSANGHLVKRAFLKNTGIFRRNGKKKKPMFLAIVHWSFIHSKPENEYFSTKRGKGFFFC